MLRFVGVQFIGEFTDLVEHAAILSDLVADFPFEFRCGAALVLNASLEPLCIAAEAVQPITNGHQRLDEPVQPEIAEDILDLLIPAADLLPDRLASGFAREIEASLFIEDRERRIDAQFDSMFAKKDSAKTMNR